MSNRTKITAKISGQIIMNGLARYSTLDSILAWVAVEQMKSSKNYDYVQTDCDNAINALPLRKISVKDGYIYCCSMPRIESTHSFALKSQYRVDTNTEIVLHKMINTTRLCKYMSFDYVMNQIGNNRIERSGGAWKTAMPVYSPSLVSHVSWVFEGDKNAVAELFSEITNIGKKTAIGYGRVLDITLDDTDEPIQRLLPVSDYNVEPMFFARLLPPYWASIDKVLMGLGEL
ncbi:MAG TPA: hypothetical protein PLV62_06955 [Spirochaetota bacterium]|nr:hypothetical protein [Spirochaetota bacterium]